ncbi:MAG TPA: TMEM175 family protein [Chthoniobacterales bacterium]
MSPSRLEAFSDGVIAIIITIMVLDMKVPDNAHIEALQPVLPVFLSYVLSFVYVGIYWNNHHHLLRAAETIDGAIMWANLHLLFWLSLFPFATGWMGENNFAPLPMALYGAVLLVAAIAYAILQRLVVVRQGKDSKLAVSIGRDLKGKFSPILYATGIALSFFRSEIAGSIYVFVALMWLVPDRRLKRAVEPGNEHK